jgi:hypothetical protein
MEFNIAVGVYIKRLEKPLYHAINEYVRTQLSFPITTPVVAKGLNAQATGDVIHAKWSQFSTPVAIGIDAKRFDQHISKDALSFEHGLYNAIYNCPHLDMLLTQQLVTHGVGYLRDAIVKYSHHGGRCSGDMNTSSGNIFIMCCICIYLIEHSGIHIDFINNGDDVVLFCEDHDYDHVNALIAEVFPPLGFTMQVEEPVYTMEHIEFCQTRPVFDGWRYIMVRNWPTAFYKDCVAIKPLTGRCPYTYFNAIGSCGLALTGGIPVFQDFYNTLIKLSNDKAKRRWDDISLETGMFNLAVGMKRYYRAATPASRASFYLAFGVTPSEQRQITEAFETELSLHNGMDPLGAAVQITNLYFRSATPFRGSSYEQH